jgi:poly(3-hydroxybutyrate) depolymerase
MTADVQDANTRMRAHGREQGYVVVQPSAPGVVPTWVAVTHDAPVFAFVESAMRAWDVDRDRVHVMGFSQGGMMTWRMVCAHADVFASAAPAAGTDNCVAGPAPPSREVPILHMHGTRDVVVSFRSAERARDTVLAAWSPAGPETIDSGPAWIARRWTTAAGTPFELWQHDLAARSRLLVGHCFPGSDDHAGGLPGQWLPFACEGAEQFDFGAQAMRFFLAHPRR